MRKLSVLAVLVFLAAPVLGQVYYEVDSGVETAEVNSTIRLSCDPGEDNCPVNSWRLTWNIPEDAKVNSIRDSLGEIRDYEVDGEKLSISTNSGDRRSSETVEISMSIDRGAEEIHKGLFKREFALPGFAGERTEGYVRDRDMISGWTGYGFRPGFTDENMTFTGTGSSRVRVNFGQGNETEYYEFFGGNPDNASIAYEISVGMTGLVQDFERFPVALMEPENYEDSVVSWSSGEYVGGSFRMRKGLGEKFMPVLAHETVHGLNERQLKWDQTSSTWFDEGTAKYVESMVNLKLKGRGRTRNLFGEDVTYQKRINGTEYRVTLPAKGEKENLWSYYQEDQDFMKNWNPMDYPERRDFGYAYSELIIKNYVAKQNGSLNELYEEIEPVNRVSSDERKWNIYSQELDLYPCKYEEKERFEECLEEINSYSYSVYRAESPKAEGVEVSLSPIEIPNRTNQEKGMPDLEETGIDIQQMEDIGSENSIFARIRELIANLIAAVTG